MRIAVRLTALAAAAGIVSGGLTACTSHGASPGGQSLPAVIGQQGRSPSLSPSPGASKPANQTVRVPSAPQKIAAKGGALADAANMRLLWSRELDTERPIGSITKVMTALVVIRTENLNRQVRIPKAVLHYVAKYQGESAGLHPGDLMTTHQLLEALLLESACDAAYVLATTYGPGMSAFLAKMNATARQLGMLHTHFTSPDGLPYPNEYATYSTPADLLTLGTAAMKLPAFRAIVAQRFYVVRKKLGHNHAYWWGNTNELIGTYSGAIGIKTGYTNAAKHCLLFEAVRHDTKLIGVVLGSPPTGPWAAAQAAARLLNWGFGLKLTPSGSVVASG